MSFLIQIIVKFSQDNSCYNYFEEKSFEPLRAQKNIQRYPPLVTLLEIFSLIHYHTYPETEKASDNEIQFRIILNKRSKILPPNGVSNGNPFMSFILLIFYIFIYILLFVIYFIYYYLYHYNYYYYQYVIIIIIAVNLEYNIQNILYLLLIRNRSYCL